jgi:hypothetical protein
MAGCERGDEPSCPGELVGKCVNYVDVAHDRVR